MTAPRKTANLEGLNTLERFMALRPFPWKRSKEHPDQIVDAHGHFIADALYLVAAFMEHEAHPGLGTCCKGSVRVSDRPKKKAATP